MTSSSLELVGSQVRLRPMRGEDRARLISIRSTTAVRAWWNGDDLERAFDAELADAVTTRLVIEFGDTVVGLVQFGEERDPEFRHASIDIYVDPGVHRQGIATDSIRTVIAHLFDDLGHHRITIDPAAGNRGAIECYRRLGFREVGVMRSYQRLADGSWADGLLMELLATDPRSL